MTNTSLLHNLPLDVIRKHILPSLDWSSRVTANTLLDPKDRLPFSLKKDAGISFMMGKEHNVIKKLLCTVVPCKPQKKNYEHIMDLMKAMKNMTFILKYAINFRNMFILKCEGFADVESAEYVGSVLTNEEKQALVALCQENLERLKTIPYEREVTSSCHEGWTAVGAGPPQIVQQTAYRVFKGYAHSYEEYEDGDWEARWSRRED